MKISHYKELEDYFINKSNIDKLAASSTLKSKQLMNVTAFLMALMKKVHELKSKLIGLGNLL